MNKEEFIEAIAEHTSFSKADSKKFIEAFFEVTQNALVEGKSIQFVGFATFGITNRAARKGRNPQTGKEITIPASKAVKFSAGKQLKEAINGTKSSTKINNTKLKNSSDSNKNNSTKSDSSKNNATKNNSNKNDSNKKK